MKCIEQFVILICVLAMLGFLLMPKNVVEYKTQHLVEKNNFDPHDNHSENDNSNNYIVWLNIACLIMGLLSPLLLLIFIVKKRHIHQWRALSIPAIIVNVCFCITAVVYSISNFFYPIILDELLYVFWITIGIQFLNSYTIYVLYTENNDSSCQNIVAAEGDFTTTAIPA